MYYSEGDKVFESLLGEKGSPAFQLYPTGSRSLHLEDKESFTEGVIRQLQNEINFDDQDVLTFNKGNLESIDIKTQETAEVLFHCIRNCIRITEAFPMLGYPTQAFPA